VAAQEGDRERGEPGQDDPDDAEIRETGVEEPARPVARRVVGPGRSGTAGRAVDRRIRRRLADGIADADDARRIGDRDDEACRIGRVRARLDDADRVQCVAGLDQGQLLEGRTAKDDPADRRPVIEANPSWRTSPTRPPTRTRAPT